MYGSSGRRRPPRYVAHVNGASDVQDGDTLSFCGTDGVYRDGQVHSRAWDAGIDPCWWVDLNLWDGDTLDLRRVAVARCCNGTLQEVVPRTDAGTSPVTAAGLTVGAPVRP